MNITNVTVTYGRYMPVKVGGQFDNVKVDVSLTADLEDGESIEEAQAELFALAKSQVKQQVLPIIAHGRNGVVEAFLALPEDQQNEIMDLAYSVKRNGKPTKSENEQDLEDWFDNSDYEDDGSMPVDIGDK